MLVAYIKRQLRIASQLSVIKVKLTVTKNRNSVSAPQLEFALACPHQTGCVGSLYQEAAWDCYPYVSGQGHRY
jgi:hypothetical protein